MERSDRRRKKKKVLAEFFAVMEVERSKEFSPVKNAEGEDSPETAVRDLCNLYGGWREKAGITVDRVNGDVNGMLEISPLFAADEDEFVKRRPVDLGFFDGLCVE